MYVYTYNSLYLNKIYKCIYMKGKYFHNENNTSFRIRMIDEIVYSYVVLIL